MGKDRSRSKITKRKKKTFLDNQKRHRNDAKVKKKAMENGGDGDSESSKKGKSSFKFKTFSEQIASVDSSIVYQLAGIGNISVTDSDSTNTTVFNQTLQKWIDLNLTPRFCGLVKKIQRYISLPQLVVGQKAIVDLLCEYLSEAGELDIQPALELVFALATDLQHEFYTDLSRVLSVLLRGPLKQREPSVIKWTLECLGHLLKTLWKPISQNLLEVYKQLSDLFNKSRPDYIRNLGAETVAFLLRKTKDKESFLEQILDIQEDTDPQAIATLLFEAIKTVNEQFNTHVKVLWSLYLKKLTSCPETDILYEIFKKCGEHSTKDHLAQLIENTFERINESSGAGDTVIVNYLLRCLKILVLLKGGKLILDSDQFFKFFELTKIGSIELMDLVTAFLKADKLHLPVNMVDTLLSNLLSSHNINLSMKLQLVSDFVSHPLFTTCLKKYYLILIQQEITGSRNHEVLAHMASILKIMSPSCTQGSQLQSWKPYTIDLQLIKELRNLPKEKVFTSAIIESIDIANPDQVIIDALFCVTSIRPIDKEQVLKKITALMEALAKDFVKNTSILPDIIATTVHLGGTDVFGSVIKDQTVIDGFLKSPTTKKSIQSLDFYLTCTELPNDHITEVVRDKILQSLMETLSQPDGELRELCLHSMLFLLPLLGPQVTEKRENNQINFLGIVRTLLQAEQVLETLNDYKDKLNLLERVDFHRVAEVLDQNKTLSFIPVHYCLGLLYTNFTLLWNPLTAILSNYGNGMKRDDFWEVFIGKLRSASDNVAKEIHIIQEAGENPVTGDTRRIDFINYRNHLWAMMTKFSQVAEANNRDVVPLFLDTFMKYEYVKIRELSDQSGRGQDSEKAIVQSTVKSLLSHLNIFVKFQDLKSVHRQAELKELVHSLLCHKLTTVQKVSLEILVAFKLKFILPYKDNLFTLLEEKDFKSELMSFQLTGDDTSIKDEHRADIIPVILRILYGRMRSKKAGKKGGGKAMVTARRGLILHHLMELPEHELQIFFDLVFKDLFDDKQQSDIDLFQYILDDKEIPCRGSQQMQACTEMVQIILAKLGKLLSPNSLRYLLSIITWLGSITQKQILVENSSPLKSLRNTLYSTLSSFYSKHDQYDFTDTEQSAIFKVYLWKLLGNFETDFIHSSSGLLQLLLTWSKDKKQKKYFLLKHPDTGVGILQTICRVLNKSATNVKVVDSVLDIIHNLVKEDSEDDMEVENDDQSTGKGIEIILAEMDTILAHFGSWICATNANLKTMRKVGIKLDILMNIAPYIEDSSTALELFKQLIILSTSLKRSDTVVKVLTISKLLMVHIEKNKVKDVVVDLVPFFGKLSNRAERNELGLIFENAAKKEPGLSLVAEFCLELNAFDKRRVEEPDFERRMAAFKKIRDVVKQGESFTELELNAVIFNCCFYLKHENDSSLKSNALDALVNVTKLLKTMSEKNPDLARTIIDKVCISQIRTGIKNKDDGVRCDFMSFLQNLVKHCGAVNGRLKDLAKLSDVDPDLDFFENIRHVQLHRRGRAMTRLAKQLEEEPGLVKMKNLTQLVLPLSTVYLLNDNYAKNSQLVEQAIELVGAINKTLPWSQYENNVKYYLELFTKEIQHQRQLVKIVTALLDAFHFDLNKDDANSTSTLDNTNKKITEKITVEKSVVPGINDDKLKTDSNDKEEASKDEVLRLRIYNTVNNVLLPKLHATLSGKTKGPNAIADEDKLILRVPLALPIVKMLKIMSYKTLYKAVPGIVNKVASFLKSKAVEVREAARSTLCSVMELLGPKYVGFVIKELQSQLQRGYQLHILTFTVHSLLHKLSDLDLLQPGDLDSSCSQVVDICISEMFGIIAEEKEVKKITGKLMEARGTKSYDSLQLVAKYVSNSHLMDLVKPIADKCATLTTFKNLTKIRECFRNIVIGLLANTGLDPLNSLIFIYGVTTDKLRIGNTGLKEKNNLAKKEDESIYIVPKIPERQGEIKAKSSKSASQHVIHEFGLNLLNFLLKRSSLVASNPEHCTRLEPFLAILMNFLSSPHVTLITASLRSLIWIIKFPLPSLDTAKILEFTNKVFDLLNKFGAGTDGKGENHDLVIIASKMLVVLIRDVELTQLDQNHLKTVLDYVVTDVMDPFKSTTAFGLLSAIIGRNLASPELHDVMLKMVELSIQNNSGQTRTAARSVVISYVTNYNLKKKLGNLLDIYTGQLGYEMVFGRLAASDTLKSLITTLGTAKIESHTTFLFFSLAPRLINDEAPEVRKSIGGTLGVLIKTASTGAVQKLLKPTLTWLQSSDNPQHAQLASHLLCIFIDTLGLAVLKPDLGSVLGVLPGHIESSQDHLAIQALHLATRLVTHGQEAKVGLEAVDTRLCSVWRAVHNVLLHSHDWVRLLSCQLVGLFLSQVSTQRVLDCIVMGEKVWLDSVTTLKSLLLNLLEQLGLILEPDSNLGTQIVKNLVALSKVLLLEGWKKNYVEEDGEKEQSLSFLWLIRKAVKVANQELTTTPKIKAKRILVFTLIAACCLDISEEDIVIVLKVILPPLHRAISNNNPDVELKNHSQEVIDLIKSKVDVDLFSNIYMEVQMNLNKKKGERIAQKKQDFIDKPQLAAKRKMKLNAKKKAKKPKINGNY